MGRHEQLNKPILYKLAEPMQYKLAEPMQAGLGDLFDYVNRGFRKNTSVFSYTISPKIIVVLENQ